MTQNTDLFQYEWLPPDDSQRFLLHNEIHTRPSQRIRVPALVVCIAVMNNEITLEQECEHLRRLPGQNEISVELLQNNFLRLKLQDSTLRWERHTEFTSYTLVQHLPEKAQLGATDPELFSSLTLPKNWLPEIPGKTIAAINLAIVHGDLKQQEKTLETARNWFNKRPIVASLIGNISDALVVTDFKLRDSGFERILLVLPTESSVTKSGRIAQRLLEIEIYRIMALRGLPVARQIDPELDKAEEQLLAITSQMEAKAVSEQELLDRLISLAARIERISVEHMYRFSATHAYHKIVTQRISELKEKAIQGTQIISEFMWRRIAPAVTKTEETAQRMMSLSERISQTGALLRTQVNIQTEKQNQQLLEKLTHGQELQLRLQRTVEGLSIAAISYYVVSLLLYITKAGKEAGLPIHPELVAGVLIPIVVFSVWYITRRIHNKFLS
jgi:uncharacterized membrane-anchored protein